MATPIRIKDKLGLGMTKSMLHEIQKNGDQYSINCLRGNAIAQTADFFLFQITAGS
jgi:hypothetical protein